jgi:hypothetical protein
VLTQSFTDVPVASDAATSSGARASTRRPRLARPQALEEAMRILTIGELMRLSRIELCHLARRMTKKLATCPTGSPQHAIALNNLRRIRYVLARRTLAPQLAP